jgi:hypothetical protein
MSYHGTAYPLQAFQKTHPPGGYRGAENGTQVLRFAIKTLVAICKDEKAPQSARVSASQAILDRGYGRPATFSTADTTQLKRAIDMTDDELAAIVAKAKHTVVK